MEILWVWLFKAVVVESLQQMWNIEQKHIENKSEVACVLVVNYLKYNIPM